MTLESLRHEMASNGIPCHTDLYLDGQLHRYGKNGLNDSKDEWYIGFQSNEHVYCTYGSWSSGETFKFKSGFISEEERIKFEQFTKEQQELNYNKFIEERKIAKDKALDILSKSTSIKDHPYQIKKNIHTETLSYKNSLVIPFSNIKGEVQTLQFIGEMGDKKFLKGGAVTGSFASLGMSQCPQKIYLCEGYATGVSIYYATNQCVIICGSLNNIIPVTTVLKNAYPDSKMYLCQDIGENANKISEEWKNKFNGVVYKPKSDKDGYDFNDLYSEKGIDSLKEIFKTKRYPSLTLHQLMEKEWEPPKWIIENFLCENSSMMIHAQGGAGKSMICCEMALALSDGTTFIAWRVPEKKRVLYIDSELQMNLLAFRMQEAIKRRQTDCEEDHFKIICTNDPAFYGNKPINLYDLECLEMLDNDVEIADVIFLDNLQNLTFDPLGEGKENKAEAWQSIDLWIKKWKSRGKTFVVVHHENKQGKSRGTSRHNGDFDQLVQIIKPETISENHEGFQVTIHPYKIRAADQKHERPRKVTLLPEGHKYFTSIFKTGLDCYQKFRGWKVEEVK